MNPTLLALGLVALAIVAVLLWPRSATPTTAPRAPAATLRQASPGRMLFDHIEEEARELAGKAFVAKLASSRADEHANSIGRAFATATPAPPTPPPNG